MYKKIKTVGLYRFYCAAKARIYSFHDTQYLKKIQDSRPKNGYSYVSLAFLDRPQMKKNHIFSSADMYADSFFSILGSLPDGYSDMPWYIDVRLQQIDPNADCTFDRTSFYRDISIVSEYKIAFSKDIKVSWELARFHYAPILTCAYAQTKNEKYLSSLKNYITSFLSAAQFLHGIHWMNPMEVAIRATNWIVAYQLVCDELKKDTNFHERLVQSLWQHMLFIEHNWELYDGRTNNHYLSNLVGYAYLCSFFNEKKRWKQCWKELQKEFAWQIQADGSSYEGSTAYHQLVTELFVHGFLVAQQMGEALSEDVKDRVRRMLQFADQTWDLHIGDDDSGSLLYSGLYDVHELAKNIISLSLEKKEQTTVTHYMNFGLSIMNQNPWRISLRHHAYTARQPSAHFHEDVGSVTLSYNGIPILIDPGTYVYTASHKWRDYFRSAAQHSSFYPRDWSQKNADLFALNVLEGVCKFVQDGRSLSASHSLFGYPVSRALSWESKQVIIRDDVRNARELLDWNFIFSPELVLKEEKGAWSIFHEGIRLLSVTSNLKLKKRRVWVSPRYGVSKPSWALCAASEGDLPIVTTRFYC